MNDIAKHRLVSLDATEGECVALPMVGPTKVARPATERQSGTMVVHPMEVTKGGPPPRVAAVAHPAAQPGDEIRLAPRSLEQNSCLHPPRPFGVQTDAVLTFWRGSASSSVIELVGTVNLAGAMASANRQAAEAARAVAGDVEQQVRESAEARTHGEAEAAAAAGRTELAVAREQYRLAAAEHDGALQAMKNPAGFRAALEATRGVAADTAAWVEKLEARAASAAAAVEAMRRRLWAEAAREHRDGLASDRDRLRAEVAEHLGTVAAELVRIAASSAAFGRPDPPPAAAEPAEQPAAAIEEQLLAAAELPAIADPDPPAPKKTRKAAAAAG